MLSEKGDFSILGGAMAPLAPLNPPMRHHDVINSKEYLTFLLLEYMIPDNHSVKILWKSKHFSRRYKRKQKSVFF